MAGTLKLLHRYPTANIRRVAALSKSARTLRRGLSRTWRKARGRVPMRMLVAVSGVAHCAGSGLGSNYKLHVTTRRCTRTAPRRPSTSGNAVEKDEDERGVRATVTQNATSTARNGSATHNAPACTCATCARGHRAGNWHVLRAALVQHCQHTSPPRRLVAAGRSLQWAGSAVRVGSGRGCRAGGGRRRAGGRCCWGRCGRCGGWP